ncbi:hypothetical protein CIC12_07135 [Burkholderia sp. SG-MS1]|nr:hypothetical protein [Paraburkholderia sp. SG-MS1]
MSIHPQQKASGPNDTGCHDKGFAMTGAAAGRPGPFPGSFETSIARVFAIGDVAAAVGERAGVAAQIHGVIEKA